MRFSLLFFSLFCSVVANAQGQSSTATSATSVTHNNQVGIGIQAGIQTLQFTGSHTNDLSSSGDYEQTPSIQITIDQPIDSDVSFVTGLRYDELSWKLSHSEDSTLDLTYLSLPFIIRGELSNWTVKPYAEVGLMISQLMKAETKELDEDLSVTSDVKSQFTRASIRAEAGVGLAFQPSTNFKVALGVHALTSLHDESKLPGVQKIAGVSALTNLTYFY